MIFLVKPHQNISKPYKTSIYSWFSLVKPHKTSIYSWFFLPMNDGSRKCHKKRLFFSPWGILGTLKVTGMRMGPPGISVPGPTPELSHSKGVKNAKRYEKMVITGHIPICSYLFHTNVLQVLLHYNSTFQLLELQLVWSPGHSVGWTQGQWHVQVYIILDQAEALVRQNLHLPVTNPTNRWAVYSISVYPFR